MEKARFHINGEGNPGKCSAQPDNCPFGTKEAHYDSKAEARQAYEERLAHARSLDPVRSKSALKRRFPEAYEAIVEKGGKLYNISRETVPGDTFITPAGRLYTIEKTSANDFNFPELGIEVVEVNPVNGVPIDEESKALEYFKDDFTKAIQVNAWGGNYTSRSQQLIFREREITGKIVDQELAIKQVHEKIAVTLAENPLLYDAISPSERLSPRGNREYKKREAKLKEVAKQYEQCHAIELNLSGLLVEQNQNKTDQEKLAASRARWLPIFQAHKQNGTQYPGKAQA